MDVREKLVELLREVQYQGNAVHGYQDKYIQNGELADHLIAHGVTVREWISVKDRLPDKNGNYLTYDPRYGDIEIYYYMGWDEWDHHRNGITDAEGHGFTHWMPLPQPPKGE